MNNFEKIKSLDIKNLAEFLQQTFDPNGEEFGCMSCSQYETHHYPNDCIEENCYWLDTQNSILTWLKKEAEA